MAAGATPAAIRVVVPVCLHLVGTWTVARRPSGTGPTCSTGAAVAPLSGPLDRAAPT